MQPLAITAYSVVNGLGAGAGAVAEGLRRGGSGLEPCDFETVVLDTYIGRVEGLEDAPVRSDLEQYDCRNNRLAQRCLETDGFAEAVIAARERYGAHRVGVFLGTSTSGLLQAEIAYRHRDPVTGALPLSFDYPRTQNSFSLAIFLQGYCGLRGPALVVSTACSSSAKVFGTAARMIAAGLCDAAVVGGVDTLCLTTLYGFNSLELLSREPCRPFDADRAGISIGEGAGLALLEKADRTAEALLLGVGESCDAHHMSTPHPEGLGARLAMERALDSAGLEPRAIDYVNLHGTASKTNDDAEDKAVCSVFGTSTPVSSTKGATGHLLGAAGITEAIVCMLAMRHSWIPGSPHTRTQDPALRADYRIAGADTRLTRVASNSFGFGGSNCTLVLGTP